MRTVWIVAPFALLLTVGSVAAETADGVVAKYIQNVGGIEKIRAVRTLRRTGRFIGNGGFEAAVVQENQRPNRVREEFIMQGLVGVNAYDGTTGWKIEPWSGKKDPEPLGEEEMKSILDDSDFDGPLVDAREKHNRVELVGSDQVEGTEVFKLRVTKPNGDVFIYYMDKDHYVPIKIDTKRIVRGAEREYETYLGNYKAVAGWYLPSLFETNVKGSTNQQRVVYETSEANVELAANRFTKPALPGSSSPRP